MTDDKASAIVIFAVDPPSRSRSSSVPSCRTLSTLLPVESLDQQKLAGWISEA